MSDAPRWAVEGRDWPLRAHSRFVAAGRLRWHVQQLGEAAAPPLLLLHGTGAATHSWRDLAPLLARRFAVTAIDLPGHGFTTGRPSGGLALPAVARAVAELMAVLEISPALVVGHSAGAAVALRMVADTLVAPRGVVGLGAALLPFPGLAARLFPALAKLLFVNPFAPLLLSRIARVPGETGRFLARSTGSRIDDAGVDEYARLFACSGHIAGAIGMMAEWDLAPLKNALPTLTVPLLLLHGEADATVPPSSARDVAALVPGTQVALLPGLGHLAHEERPDEIATRILAFGDAIGAG